MTKLVIAIVRDLDDMNVNNALVEKQFRVTRVASTGGFLRRGYVTLLIGTEDDKTQAIIDLINASCQEPEAGQHKATIFVVNAVHFEQT
jgi:uncharacterized protein YaaQ